MRGGDEGEMFSAEAESEMGTSGRFCDRCSMVIDGEMRRGVIWRVKLLTW